MEPDQPPTFHDNPVYPLQPASTDQRPFQGNGIFLDLSAPSRHGSSTHPEILQRNVLPGPSHQSSMPHPLYSHFPRGDGSTATFVPCTNTDRDPLSLGAPPQFQHVNGSQPLGALDYPHVEQPQTIHPFLAADLSLHDWPPSTSLPQISLGPHPQPRARAGVESGLVGCSLENTLSGPPPEAATTSARRELIEEPAPQVINLPPSAVRGIELESPRPADGETTVRTRLDTLITLGLNMQSLFSGSAPYDGLKIPKTPGVRSVSGEAGKKLLHLQIRVLGATTKTPYETLCHKCKEREGDRDAFPDFRARSCILVPQRDGRVLVSFVLACRSDHREPHDSEYCLEVILNGGAEQSIPHIQYQLPYSFNIVSKLPPRARNPAEDVDQPPSKLPKTVPGRVSANPGPSRLDELLDGDSRGPTNNIPSSTSGPPAPVDNHHPASPAEAPIPSCQHRQAVNTANDETADGEGVVILRINPRKGPMAGGQEIWIEGSNFPTNLKPLFVRFGSNPSCAAVYHSVLLSCTLPQADAPGMVKVVLSRSSNPRAPVLGTSICQFEYVTDLNEMMLIMIRIQKRFTPEVAYALDHFHKEMKRHTLKQPLRGGEASHDEIEAAIIQALAPLHNAQDFGDIISETNDYKQTLAHFAVLFGYADLLRRLVGWNIDLSIADVNGFTALHCAYKKGNRSCVDLLLEKGASETVLDALGRAPSHLMPERFASLNDHDIDTASDDQLEIEPKGDAPSLFQSTDSRHGVSDSGDEGSMNKAELADLMHPSRSSSAASNSQGTVRSPPPPVAPAPPLSPAPLVQHPPSPRIRLPPPPPLRHGQEPSMTSALRSPTTCSPSGAIRAVPADFPIALIPYSPQSPPPIWHHQNECTVINQDASPSPPPPPHPPLPPDFQTVLSPPARYSSSKITPLSSPRPLNLPSFMDAAFRDWQGTAVPSPVYFGRDFKNNLETQKSPESFACGGFDSGAQADCVQNKEHAAVPQQHDVRTNHEPMNHDQTAAVPVPQTTVLLVDESGPQVTSPPPSAVRGIELENPRPADGETTVRVRRDARITLSFNMKILSMGSATYDGLKIPSTPSVRSEGSEEGKNLLSLQIRVLGATTKAPYETFCDKCKEREGDRRAFPDFRARSNIFAPQRDGRVLVSFMLFCCSNHRKPRDSEYCLEVILNGGPDIPLIRYQLPFFFNIVSKHPPRARSQAEGVDAIDAAVPPPSKLPRTRTRRTGVTMHDAFPFLAPPKLPGTGRGRVGRVGDSVSQDTGPSRLNELSAGDYRPEANSSSGFSGPPVSSVDNDYSASSVEAPISPRRCRQTVNAADDEETADGWVVVEKVLPDRGPKTGGPEIYIRGSNFPDNVPLYVRFGDKFARAFPEVPTMLSCRLPPASVPGTVKVTLSRSPNPNAPIMGTSLCTFEYMTELNEILPVLIRIQEDCSPEVAAALDVLQKEVKTRDMKNGKRSLRGLI